MSAGQTEISAKNAVSADDQQASKTLANSTTDNVILSFRTPSGLKGKLTFFGQAWDAPLTGHMTFSLRINGGRPFGFNQLAAQIAPPEQPSQELAAPLELEQQSLIEVLASVTDGVPNPTSNTFTARVIVKYYQP